MKVADDDIVVPTILIFVPAVNVACFPDNDVSKPVILLVANDGIKLSANVPDVILPALP